MKPRLLPRPSNAALFAVAPIALTLACLVVGYEPIGADPDLLYRPIKAELARALRAGHLPLWSDHFGLGVPLAAESHVAAFYPPNWVAYRLLNVAVAFRLLMALHCIATAAATYAYARCLGLTSWGSALAAVSFSLCGFQAIHSGHEPLYHAMPYLPLCLLAADRYAATGRLNWLAILALAWGVQLTVGHFQIQLWTGGLALFTGLWRVVADRRPPARALGLAIAIAWGLAIAAVQLVPTRELTRVGGFTRSFDQLVTYALPPSNWVNPTLPFLFAPLPGTDASPYWGPLASSPGEATFYVGTVPLILASVGLFVRGGPVSVWPWRIVLAASLIVATLPGWWPFGYWMLTCVPGMGQFRCPARYTLLASLGLAVLAGRGLDRSISVGRTRAGLILALILAMASFAWAVLLIDHSPLASVLGRKTIPLRLGASVVVWVMGMSLICAWRRGRVGAWSLVGLTALELSTLYHLGPVRWSLSVPLPGSSPILARLAREPGVGRIAGRLENLPARSEHATPAFPYLGIPAPPPNYVLEATRSPEGSTHPEQVRLMIRLGVTHGVWRKEDAVPNGMVVFASEDEVLDRLVGGSSWKVVAYQAAWPDARACRVQTILPGWEHLYQHVIRTTNPDEALYLPEEAPPDRAGPRATMARVVRWDGREAVVEHDGECDLIVNRTYYPGWTARIDGAAAPVLKADAGLQAVALSGAGTHKVVFTYRPTALVPAAITSAIATLAALLIIAITSRRLRP